MQSSSPYVFHLLNLESGSSFFGGGGDIEGGTYHSVELLFLIYSCLLNW